MLKKFKNKLKNTLFKLNFNKFNFKMFRSLTIKMMR